MKLLVILFILKFLLQLLQNLLQGGFSIVDNSFNINSSISLKVDKNLNYISNYSDTLTKYFVLPQFFFPSFFVFLVL